ncbi:MAG: T9SS type A sorting domain-containing protein [Saprospiraceae bacterium]|nr:T9SS type A sorting domain-containing protein [Saprospiraceae bacterium]
MKTFFTILKICSVWLFALAVLAFPGEVQAQCQMACVDKVNVSVDPNNDCQVTISAATMMKGTESCPLTGYTVKVKYGNQVWDFAPSISLGPEFIGKTVEVTVRNQSSNSCWGTLKIEDKTAPLIENCPEDTVDIHCALVEQGLTPEDFGVTAYDCSSYNWIPGGAPIVVNCPEEGVLKNVTQVWKAVDPTNGMFSTCTISYNVLPILQEDINFPGNDTVNCNDNYAKVGGSWFPSPEVTGYPYVIVEGDTIKIKPGDEDLLDHCGIMSSYTDREIKSYKLMRTWTVNGWYCGTEFDTTVSQVIILIDDVAPLIDVTPESVTVSTSGHECFANVVLNSKYKVVTSDACGGPVTIKVTEAGIGIINPAAPTKFAPGTYTLVYTATDGAGNTATDEVTLIVADLTPPVMACIENTVVSLTSDGTAKIPAKYFDNGSRDECGPVTFDVRRMDRFKGCDTSANRSWGPYVEFCCLDGANPVIIELRATDASGNSNTCMVQVRVQDKLRPIISCPGDVTVFCSDVVALDSASLASKFGSAIVYDNCGSSRVVHTVKDNRDKCHLGTIVRKWVVIDGIGRADSCTQTIYSEFKEGENFDPEEDLKWPEAEITIEGCTDPASPSLTPDGLNSKPIVNYSGFGCGNIAMNSKDEVYTFNSPVSGSAQACLKILRTWSVIDWCQPSSVRSPWTFKQIIKVNNSIPPKIDSSFAASICLFIDGCDGTGSTDLRAFASDDCTGNLSYTYSIDLDNDNAGPLSGYDIVKSGTGGFINASKEVLPIGTHRIVYTFRDLCGNITSKEHVFSIKNCKKPSPKYFQGLVFGLTRMNGGGMSVTWGRDFDNGSSAPCPDSKLYFAFSENIADSGKVFTCADLGIQKIRVYVGAEVAPGEIIWDSAEVMVEIQDNGTPKACTGEIQTKTVRGQLITESNSNLKDALIQLDGISADKIMTNDRGEFTFNNIETGRNYMVKPGKNDDVANGVNTLDLLHIQRHILGMAQLRSPYKMIAADANRDAQINVADLVELKRIVLRVNDKLPNNTSWRFIDKNYSFTSTENALAEAFREQYEIVNLNDNMQIDFVAVKIGDIDATAATSATTNTNVRSAGKTIVTSDHGKVSKGETFSITLKLNEDQDIYGLQYGLKFDVNKVEFVDITSNVEGMSSESFNLANSNDGLILSSWTAPYGESIKDLVTITFKAKQNLSKESILEFNDAIIPSQAYDQSLETYTLEMRNGNSGFELFQNQPNPFGSQTTINFTLPEAMTAKLTIFDMTGKAVKRISQAFVAGQNQITISSTDLDNAGMYFYTLEAGSFIATKKMVILE